MSKDGWEDEFVELLFSNNPMKIDAKKAAKLKYDNFPDFLYKYRVLDTDSLSALREDKIYLSDPLEFNDPYDCVHIMEKNYNISDNEMKEIAKRNPSGFRKAHKISKTQFSKLFKDNNPFIKDLSRCMAKNENPKFKNDPKKIREISKIIEQDIREYSVDFGSLKKYLLVSCFSRNYDSILMWSHYASDHTGFCIEYDFKSSGYNSHLTRNLFPIKYTNKIFTIDDYIYNKYPNFPNVHSSYLNGINLNKIIEGIQLKFFARNNKMNDMFPVYAALNKYEGWKHENEWRYVLYCQNESHTSHGNTEFFIKAKPTAIYLGAKLNDKDEILKVAKDKHIDVYQMSMKSSEYALENKKIS